MFYIDFRDSSQIEFLPLLSNKNTQSLNYKIFSFDNVTHCLSINDWILDVTLIDNTQTKCNLQIKNLNKMHFFFLKQKTFRFFFLERCEISCLCFSRNCVIKLNNNTTKKK